MRGWFGEGFGAEVPEFSGCEFPKSGGKSCLLETNKASLSAAAKMLHLFARDLCNALIFCIRRLRRFRQ